MAIKYCRHFLQHNTTLEYSMYMRTWHRWL